MVQAGAYAGCGGIIFLMEPHHDTGAVLFLQFPQELLQVPVGLDAAVGIHEVEEVLDAGIGVYHVDDRYASGSPVDAAPHPPVMPLVKGSQLGGVRLLRVDQHRIVKGALVEPCDTGQQAFPLCRCSGILLYGRSG